VVGIGASAGGLEAFSQLLKHLPLDTGFAFVLVQHLDPQHESALAQLLRRVTAMPVHEVTNNLRVEANHVYIIPPNTSMGIARGTLKLRPRLRDRLAPRSVDSFFEALAKDQGERAIGVILSGSASDGTLGLEAIKAAGGFTFAQDSSASFDSMPHSAVAAGCVDLILSPGLIAKELGRMAKHPYVGVRDVPPPLRVGGDGREKASGLDGGNGYEKILLLLRNHCEVDFSLYKASTIRRRIARRIVLNRLPTVGRYAKFLQRNPKELDALYSDALISVTSFFRNEDAFEALRRKVFPRLLEAESQEPVRIWVLGCSTGQEPYSIAMAFAEFVEKMPRARKLQIFATDLNEANLDKARAGYYSKNQVQDVSPGRLRRFFVEEGDGYRAIKSLRESVVFARQNVISDPPFSRMDLISCRNLMIYFEPGLQKRLLANFHYALKSGGFLFLGASESVSGFNHLFLPVDKKQKIFSKRVAPAAAFHLPLGVTSSHRPRRGKWVKRAAANQGRPEAAGEPFRTGLSLEREADRLTINQFAPPGVLISANLQILQFRGSTNAYLEPPTGKASFDLLRMARPGLMLPLRAVIDSAMRQNQPARVENVSFKLGGKTSTIHLEVLPLHDFNEPCFLVLFVDARMSLPKGNGALPNDVRIESTQVAGLERDLSDTRDYLRSVQERHEVANDELQASNDEGQSANEELQSLNEELETSKEELESTNEELTTVNEEIVSRNAELNRLMAGNKIAQEALRVSDARFRALFELEPVGIYSCDVTGAIREFNRCAAELWGRRPKTGEGGEKFCGSIRMLRPDGTPLLHARCPMAAVLKGQIASARNLEVVIERPDRSRRMVVVNIVPLKNEQGAITGAINCFYDITERQKLDLALRQAQIQLAQHALKLESQVVKRTLDLTATNRRLQSAVESNRRGKEQYRELLEESHVMQAKLRHLTRQIITAQEEERKQISRELHDEVVQTLIGINVELTNLDKAGTLGAEAGKKKIAHVQQLVEDSVNAVHRFARGLRPAVLDDLGLIPALHAYCKGLTAKIKLNIQLTAFRGVEGLDGRGKTALFRVAQEALTNIVRHAHATQVKIRIVKEANAIRMEISDNGQSFRVANFLKAKSPKRLGLVGMKERIEMVGGRLAIESLPGTGTTVRADIPFRAEKKQK